ncbi:uncharacterized protein F5891DRAFT_1040051 [Suillus fuscotomentosus]|uniref:Uncharacterized protein n=1 Tax=Suillus fuscotomentosus TaxID=1912939 RepID=A0AAD4E3V4_9AGAM|nr:uncharacterized protein F5891DRAFT_1040051 [Suillus fuscotomentosus]KAG1899196.1 hypothetical protein F5891DRAFT_1040051 [Suillus fuscotomentosus]KAG2061869.1 hypothetical protein BDR06DRAFT_1000983 [Suillus hirtellus]
MYLLSFLLALPLLSLAQSSQSVQLSTSTIVEETLGSNRQTSTVTQITVFTITPAPTASGTVSASGNSSSAITSGTNNGTTTSIASSNLPTAASTIAGADGGPNGAPSPGASASGGIYGPPDGYIAGAQALRSANILGAVVFLAGGALVLL